MQIASNLDIAQSGPRRNPDGTYMKGYSGHPGGAMKLARGQKIVREFAIDCLPDIMRRLKLLEGSTQTWACTLLEAFWSMKNR